MASEVGPVLLTVGVVMTLLGVVFLPLCGVGLVLLVLGLVLMATESRSTQAYPAAGGPRASGAAPATWTPQRGTHFCSECGAPLSWIAAYEKWFCGRCRAYR